MNRRRLIVSLATVALVLSAPAGAQFAGTDHAGAQAIGLALRRMATTKRVLMIGAHPDDENTAVLATLALRDGADVAYLSLTRGDGGQNLIGPELQEGLGLIRSEELLAARRIDGARQFFTRAYDYGYSKSADEAFRHWPRDSVLADVVAVIRGFRPDVVISVWNGTQRDGHGQHQAAGIIAREAFEVAADPSRFADQIRAGLAAHRATYLVQSTWRPAGEVALWLSTGEFDPLFGRSSYQISMESRSLHRSQDQGSAQPPGPQRTAVLALGGSIPDPMTSLFEGIDTTLSALARSGAASPDLVSVLETWDERVAQAIASFNPLRPDAGLPALHDALSALERADSILTERGGSPQLKFRVEAERSVAEEVLRLAAGVVIEAVTDDARVVPGQTFELTAQLWNGGTAALTVGRLEPRLPPGWSTSDSDPVPTRVGPGEMATRRFRVSVPVDAAPVEPYYLTRPRQGDLYTWPEDRALRGEPFGPPPVWISASLLVGGSRLDLEKAATFIDVDKAVGERRLPVLVVPAVSVLVQPRVAIIPLGAERTAQVPERDVTVTLRNEAPGGISGSLRLEPPPGWSVEPSQLALRFDAPGEQRTVRFAVTPPAGITPGRYSVGAVFEAGGQVFRRGYATIAYPHTEPRLLFRDASTTFSTFPVLVRPDLRVGYIEGAGDDGAIALSQLGLDVELLGPDDVRSADLGRYDVIVAGIRTYEVRQDVIDANQRLLDWVRAGGTYVVQYNKHEFVRGGFAPWPLTIAQSADRVTDEQSPVSFPVAGHPVLTAPNHIGPEDFEGWVQERGLYFPDSWDDRYTALLELHDPGEPAQRGSLLVTKYGAGTWIYTSLSLFRQLPEGVPGAYRLLANLVSSGGLQ